MIVHELVVLRINVADMTYVTTSHTGIDVHYRLKWGQVQM